MSHERILTSLLILVSFFLMYREAIGRSSHLLAWDGKPSVKSPSPGKAHAAHGAARFAIMSMAGNPTTFDFMTISNKYKYATKHNYDMVWDFDPSEGYAKSWDKLNITAATIQRSLSGERSYEWVWMLDLDTLVMNTNIQLDDLVNRGLELAEAQGKQRDDVHMILNRDCEELNAGSMLFRASPWMLDMLKQWSTYKLDPEEFEEYRYEQGVLKHMLRKNVFSAADKSVLVPQVWMNSYPEEIQCYDPRDKELQRPWEYGDLVLHFAGAAYHLPDMKDPVGTLMRNYIRYVE